MSSTNAAVAKRAIIERLNESTGPGGLLADVQVAYRWPGTPSRRCVWLGGVSLNHADGMTSSEADTIDLETATVGLYVRVMVPVGDADVMVADAAAQDIAEIIHGLLSQRPKLPGADNMHYVGISGGRSDYQLTDDEAISVLALQLAIASYV